MHVRNRFDVVGRIENLRARDEEGGADEEMERHACDGEREGVGPGEGEPICRALGAEGTGGAQRFAG